MAFDNFVQSVSLPAAADLSAAQFKLLTVNSSGNAALAGATSLVVGVLQNKPDAAGKAATVAYAGVSKVVAGGSITAGARVTADANGAAVAAASAGDAVLGVALATASSGDLIPVLINPYPFAALA
jgi:hypothetical protein